MGKGLGALVFVVGVAGLGYWGAQSHAVTMQTKIAGEAAAVVGATMHPMTATVSGRDITLTGTADTEAELSAILAGLGAVPGRRVVNAADVAVLPAIAPFETAIAKGADGSYATTGYAPTAALRDALADRHPALAGLPLAHGAPEGWPTMIDAGFTALGALQDGSVTLTGTTLTLAGTAATPMEDETARAALSALDGADTIVALEILDPGIVDFRLGYDAASGFRLDGTLPDALGRGGVASALGVETLSGETGTTYATVDGLEGTLAGLGAQLSSLDRVEMHVTNADTRVTAEPMPGLDPGAVEQALSAALGPGVMLSIQVPDPPQDGAERRNAATGRPQFAAGGVWMNRPEFDPTGRACNAAARATVAAAPIRFVTGSAELDPVSLATINDIAGIVHHCTQAPGARVTIGGHTDAEGNDAANYSLSVARAKAVRDALKSRGVDGARMMPVGYGETEPVAENDTEDGRAKNRRISFEWPE